jgi:Flp pilus assembly protein TadG
MKFLASGGCILKMSTRYVARATRGNVALIFALLLPVILCAIGGAIDFTFVLLDRTQLQDALDMASVGSITTSSAAYTAATTMTTDGPIASGASDATTIFNANLKNVPSLENVSITSSVVKSGSNLTSTLTATAYYTTTFAKLIGISTIPLTATSVSVNSMPLYKDFYLLLDVSGSMGLPSTNSEESRLAAINPDDRSEYPNGCTFACHFSGYQGYTLSRNGGNSSNTPVTSCPTPGTSACIQLRLDAVGYAVNQLLQIASSTQKIPNQYRVGLYPFIVNMYQYSPLTYNLSGSVTTSGTINYAAANLANLLDNGVNSNLGSGGTHFENALPALNSIISSVGTGQAASTPQPWVFFVTDGSQDYQIQSNGNWSGSNHATTLNPSLCTTLKNRGIMIAVLYIPYQPIQNPTSFANDEDYYANNNIPNIPAPLQSCASSASLFRTANTPTDITNQLTQIFYLATNYDRISQ